MRAVILNEVRCRKKAKRVEILECSFFRQEKKCKEEKRTIDLEERCKVSPLNESTGKDIETFGGRVERKKKKKIIFFWPLGSLS